MSEPPAEATLRIVLADDHPLFRHGLRQLLEQVGGHTVVAEAGDGAEALEAFERYHPDVTMLDLRMPGMDGVQATREITAISPSTRVIVLTSFSED